VKPDLIAIDWGTSALRAYLVGDGGRVLDRRSSSEGVLAVPRDEFEIVLARLIQDWRVDEADAAIPITMSGMIGGRQGWIEAPYCTAPATVAELAGSLVRFETELLGPIVVVPGVKFTDQRGVPDVMRGEEAQIIGALIQSGRRTGLFVLPGTHSKWITVSSGAITAIRTYMTGEIYATLLNHSILGRLADGDRHAPTAFNWGVKTGSTEGGPGSLLHLLFSARTRPLLDELPATDVASYLSGMLIGAELANAGLGPGAFHIIANDTLQLRYGEAATILGLEHRTIPTDCVARGHLEIALAAGLIGAPA
jgi:2-dehydro-3-deoxygalactonokinase